MPPEHWRQIEELFHAALERQPADRPAFLAEAAASEEVQREVLSLLAQDASGGRLDRPAWEGKGSAAPAAEIEGRFLPGTLLAGRYRIVAPLGIGGMGEVYRATDLTLRQAVALKFLPRSLTDNARALNRLYGEVGLARQISHPNVCRVYDIAEADGLRFLTMEYIDGENLHSFLRRIGRLPAEKASDIARGLCAGLSAVHDRGVLHRDLKPANIMIDAQGNARITDFGLAVLSDRLDPRDLRSGTPAYMAPEQLAGEQVSVRSDIYSLGLVLYEVFGARNPFKDTRAAQLLRETKPAALSGATKVEPWIEDAVMHCLETDPRNRPPSAAAVAVELSGGDPLAAAIAAGDTPGPELVARAGSTAGLPVGAAAACLATVFAALILFAFLAPRLSILSRVRVETSDALELGAREMLFSLGLEEGIQHRVTRFAYDMDAMRRGFDGLALYFWYRASPDWMIPSDLTGIMSPGNPPAELPGMVTTKWDGTGRLLYLEAVPWSGGAPAIPASAMPASQPWPRLFAAAGLELGDFKPAPSDWIAAPGWDAQASWTGVYPDANRTAVRVEAAAWRGRPVYFEVVPSWRSNLGVRSVITTQRLRSRDLVVFIVLFAASAVLAWRNVRLGKGDRRGAFRIAAFVLAVIMLDWACKASHVPDLLEFTILAAALTWAGFITLGFWAVYMAFEPYVRRRWPHAIISWTRILSGKLRDPVVGGHILMGAATGAAMVALIAIGFSLVGSYSPRLPSLWVVSGTWGAFGYVFIQIGDAVFRGLTLLLVTSFCRVIFRWERLAVPGTIVIVTLIAFVVEPPNTLTPAVTSLVIVPVAAAYVYLLLRVGLVPVIVASCVSEIVLALPLTADPFAPTTAVSLVVLCGVAALAMFGFHSTLAGRPLWNLDW